MKGADSWFICRTGYVEVVRAVGAAGGPAAMRAAIEEWPAFAVIEVDQPLVEHAATLALERELRSLDALHLAAAHLLPREELALATWDRRLHAAAGAEGFDLMPASLP